MYSDVLFGIVHDLHDVGHPVLMAVGAVSDIWGYRWDCNVRVAMVNGR
jgi:hypothetical protein